MITDDWKDCSSLQELAAAQARGDEIEISYVSGEWSTWNGVNWHISRRYRCRPKKKTKTIVVREALVCHPLTGLYPEWIDEAYVSNQIYFVQWLPTPPREIEVEETI